MPAADVNTEQLNSKRVSNSRSGDPCNKCNFSDINHEVNTTLKIASILIGTTD